MATVAGILALVVGWIPIVRQALAAASAPSPGLSA
jgi:hypothetical protein